MKLIMISIILNLMFTTISNADEMDYRDKAELHWTMEEMEHTLKPYRVVQDMKTKVINNQLIINLDQYGANVDELVIDTETKTITLIEVYYNEKMYIFDKLAIDNIDSIIENIAKPFQDQIDIINSR